MVVQHSRFLVASIQGAVLCLASGCPVVEHRETGYWRLPAWASRLSNLYWRLRAARSWDSAARRKWYRYIRFERDDLVNLGIDAELVRLACRYFSDPRCGPALDRLVAFEMVVNRLRFIQGAIDLASIERRPAGFFPDLSREFRTKHRQRRAHQTA